MRVPPVAERGLPNTPHLLIVEDEVDVATMLRRYFEPQGFRVTHAADGAAMRLALDAGAVDVVLLDLGLPDEDGFALTRHLREHWRGAIIIVTGRGDSIDRVVGLELGADDYVTKPLDLRELLARVRSVLRRSNAAPTPTTARACARIVFAGFTLDADARRLTDAHGSDVDLTAGEFDLLLAFLQAPNRVLSRDNLMEHVHGRSSGPFDRAIDVQVGRLRRKIEADPAKPTLIKSVRSAGYLFAAAVTRG